MGLLHCCRFQRAEQIFWVIAMNMELQKPQGTELQFVHSALRELPEYMAFDSSSTRRRSPVKYLLWPIAGLGLATLFTTASATLLLALAGGFVALLVTVTAVCISAQNNSRY